MLNRLEDQLEIDLKFNFIHKLLLTNFFIKKKPKKALLGQGVGAAARCFVFQLPIKIAATWFPSDELAVAASIGVIGYQLGWAVGFLIPPLIIIGPVEAYRGVAHANGAYYGTFPSDWRNETQWSNVTKAATDEVSHQILVLFSSFSVVCVVLFGLISIIARDNPTHPANKANRRQSKIVESRR